MWEKTGFPWLCREAEESGWEKSWCCHAASVPDRASWPPAPLGWGLHHGYANQQGSQQCHRRCKPTYYIFQCIRHLAAVVTQDALCTKPQIATSKSGREPFPESCDKNRSCLFKSTPLQKKENKNRWNSKSLKYKHRIIILIRVTVGASHNVQQNTAWVNRTNCSSPRTNCTSLLT